MNTIDKYFYEGFCVNIKAFNDNINETISDNNSKQKYNNNIKNPIDLNAKSQKTHLNKKVSNESENNKNKFDEDDIHAPNYDTLVNGVKRSERLKKLPPVDYSFKEIKMYSSTTKLPSKKDKMKEKKVEQRKRKGENNKSYNDKNVCSYRERLRNRLKMNKTGTDKKTFDSEKSLMPREIYDTVGFPFKGNEYYTRSSKKTREKYFTIDDKDKECVNNGNIGNDKEEEKENKTDMPDDGRKSNKSTTEDEIQRKENKKISGEYNQKSRLKKNEVMENEKESLDNNYNITAKRGTLKYLKQRTKYLDHLAKASNEDDIYNSSFGKQLQNSQKLPSELFELDSDESFEIKTPLNKNKEKPAAAGITPRTAMLGELCDMYAANPSQTPVDKTKPKDQDAIRVLYHQLNNNKNSKRGRKCKEAAIKKLKSCDKKDSIKEFENWSFFRTDEEEEEGGDDVDYYFEPSF